MPNPRGSRTRMKIGLLGGSFNPAHEGHRYISQTAIRILGLHKVWWLVSPQNPLKSSDNLLPLKNRLTIAHQVANHPSIMVSDFESFWSYSPHQHYFTYETIKQLKRRYPAAHFIWIIGADNLEKLSKWKKWTKIFYTLPLAVFSRFSLSSKTLRSKAPQYFKHNRVFNSGIFANSLPPAWTFIHMKPNRMSSTALRTSSHKIISSIKD